MAGELEIGAHGITAILATWLGLIVLTRAGGQRGARVFAFVTGLLVVWSLAIIIERLSTDPGVDVTFNAIEDVAAFLLPAATLHVALALTVEGNFSVMQRRTLIASYVLCAAVALEAVVLPDQPLAVTTPHLAPFGMPGEILGWAWILARILIFGAALYWIIAALRVAGDDAARQRQLQAALATVGIGALGGILRILPGVSESDPWIGVSLVTAAMVLAAYAVFVQGLFMSTDVAGRAFSYTMVVGIGVILFVSLVGALERVTQEVLHVQVPIVTGLALVVTIALLGPLTDLVRRVLRGRSPRDRAYYRLLQALGEEVLTAQRPDTAMLPALSRLTRIFRLKGAAVMSPTGELLAEHGTLQQDDPLALRLPLRYHDRVEGTVIFAAKQTEPPVHGAGDRAAHVGCGVPGRVAEPGAAQ